MKVLILTISAACWCALSLSLAADHPREESGISMPEMVSVANRDLKLNGMGVAREKAVFKVYVAGLYLENPTTDAPSAINTDEAKRIVLVMLRDVSRETFVQAVETGILRNSSIAMPALRARLDILEQALPALKRGNVLDFTYLPGTGTLVRGQGKEMTITGKDFADALFSAWLGMKPVMPLSSASCWVSRKGHAVIVDTVPNPLRQSTCAKKGA
jgi:hypothetical protein